MRFHVSQSIAAAIVGLAILTGPAYAVNDILAQWDFQTSTPAEVMDVAMGPTVAANTGSGSMFGLHASAMTDWTTPTGNGSTESFSANAWAIGDYFQFQTNASTAMDIGIVFDQTGSDAGPRDFKLQWSTDGGTFTDFGDPYELLPGNWFSSSSTRNFSTYSFDLSSIAALNNDDSIYFRLVNTSTVAVNSPNPVDPGGTSRIDNITIYGDFDAESALPAYPPARLPMGGDVVLGLSTAQLGATLELVRDVGNDGDGDYDGPGPWPITTQFIQSVSFDNKNGTLHNAKGNLLGVNFGATATVDHDNDPGTAPVRVVTTPGEIYSFATQGPVTAPAGQLVGRSSNGSVVGTNFTHADGIGGNVTPTTLTGISVNPNNTRVAVAGAYTGSVIVYDYAAGDSMGSGAALTNGRETSANTFFTSGTAGTSTGTAWRDDNTVMVLDAIGEIIEVEDGGALSVGARFAIPSYESPIGSSIHTALAYNPEVSSDLLFAYVSWFSGSAANWLYVLDIDGGTVGTGTGTTADDYTLVKKLNFTNTINQDHTGREIALDADGNLLLSGRQGTIYRIEDAVSNVANLTDTSAVLWYDSITQAGFAGIDVGFAAPGVPGDYNGDGRVDGGDYVRWRNHLGEGNEDNINNNGDGGGVGISDYTFWKDRYGNPGSGGGGLAAPEPTGFALLLIGLAAVACGRRNR